MLKSALTRPLALVAGAIVLFGAVAGAGALWLRSHPQVKVASSARECVSPPVLAASLFADDEWTQVRVSRPDLTGPRVLRTEPANVLPGMFQSLLALSPDSSRLAYVTATSEMMDGAHLYWLDVAGTGERHPLADVPQGLSPVRPAWSPDAHQVAYVIGRGGAQPGYEIWDATADGSAPPAKLQDLPVATFSQGHTAALCWTRTGQIGVLPEVDSASAQAGPTSTPVPRPSASASPLNGSGDCAVPVLSQNDPTWHEQIMQAGADSIGGYGCALTSTAMLLDYYGATMTPAQLNGCLGTGADPIQWSQAPGCTAGRVTGGDRADFSWPALDAVLASGRPAIVGMARGLTGEHFVVVTSGGGGVAEGYRITDPWDGSTTKTLGSYTNVGYNPLWIVTYDGRGRNCGRLVAGRPSPVGGFTDGGSYRGGVTLTVVSGNVTVINVAQGQGAPASPSPGPTPSLGEQGGWGKVYQVNKFLHLEDEGVYQVIVRQPKGWPGPVLRLKFTIDHTPPAVAVSLLNQVGGSAPHAAITLAYTTPFDDAVPTLEQPGQVRIQARDALSGVRRIDYSLDGGPLAAYSDDVSFSRTLLVPQPGPHTITFQALDVAGNPSDAGQQQFVVQGAAPTPSPTPTPPARTPTPRPTPTATPPWVWSLDPTSLTWLPGIAVVSKSSALTVTGQSPVTIQSIAYAGSFPASFSVTSDCLGRPLPPGSTCTITVTFTPQNVIGPNGRVVVTPAVGPVQSISLTGFSG